MEDTCVLCVAGLYLEVCSAIYTYTLNNFRHCYVPSAVFMYKKIFSPSYKFAGGGGHGRSLCQNRISRAGQASFSPRDRVTKGVMRFQTADRTVPPALLQ